MTRLKIHNMAEGGAAQATIAEKCQVGLRSVERILAEAVPTACEVAANFREAAPRRGRPSKADEMLVAWLRKELAADPKMMATELLRRSRERGYKGGKSALSERVKDLRPSPKVEPVVRFGPPPPPPAANSSTRSPPSRFAKSPITAPAPAP